MGNISEDRANFLAGLYDPPQRRLVGLAGKPVERAKAGAGGRR